MTETQWYAMICTRDAERVARRCYYEIIVLHSQHADILKEEQYKMAAGSLAQPDRFRQEEKGLT